MSLPELGKVLEALYKRYNRREYVHPDPLEFLYRFDNSRDREIVALVASSLAYGRVSQILRAVSSVLDVTGPSPHQFVSQGSLSAFRKAFSGFRHRFACGDHMAALLSGAGRAVKEYGSLNECFVAGMKKGDPNVMPAVGFFANRLVGLGGDAGHLVPDPAKGSACKRLNLFLRWMVRKDGVDPGGWEGIDPAMLVVPIDTHMLAIGRRLGFTARRQADIRTAIEITEGFKAFSPNDPVKYDFALTRFGIRREMDIEDLFST